MSAFMVSKEHIDALVTAAIYDLAAIPNRSRGLPGDDRAGEGRRYQAGEPWGPRGPTVSADAQAAGHRGPGRQNRADALARESLECRPSLRESEVEDIYTFEVRLGSIQVDPVVIMRPSTA